MEKLIPEDQLVGACYPRSDRKRRKVAAVCFASVPLCTLHYARCKPRGLTSASPIFLDVYIYSFMSAIGHPGALLPTKGLAKAAVALEMMRRGTEGHISFDYEGKTFYTWYQSVGDHRRNRSSCRPLVVIHGGPGLTSNYMSTLAGLRATHGIPVIFYDQLGCGRSSLLQSSLDVHDPSFWTLELFLAELDNVLRYMGLRDSDERGFDLLGHGFGGVIAAEYATTFSPRGLRRLVLSSTPASFDLWQKSRTQALEEHPEDVRDILRLLEKVDHTQSEEYRRTMMTYLRKQICTLDPWPQILNDSLTHASSSPAHRTLYDAH